MFLRIREGGQGPKAAFIHNVRRNEKVVSEIIWYIRDFRNYKTLMDWCKIARFIKYYGMVDYPKANWPKMISQLKKYFWLTDCSWDLVELYKLGFEIPDYKREFIKAMIEDIESVFGTLEIVF